eukprot:CAMPEP_0174233428 /NCGR_PEP_ID=MMETSP0417-20130205/3468_1 /TAXON_ID=242541 /ORGANISM="Mayorella sp, Strain BSH-02190019" /LENGTH=177 /DNA_ID=CAMNT_0015311637 /DNA_START=46 /DNA_END=576 /DNA_ORIENTATION=+
MSSGNSSAQRLMSTQDPAADAELFAQDTYAALIRGAAAANRLPAPDDHAVFMQSAPPYASRMSDLSHRLLSLTQNFVSQHEPSVLLTVGQSPLTSGSSAPANVRDTQDLLPAGLGLESDDVDDVLERFDRVVDVVDDLIEGVDAFADALERGELQNAVAAGAGVAHNTTGVSSLSYH